MVHYFKILLLFFFQSTFCQFGLLYQNFIISGDGIPTDSLKAYYPFNGNANDESGNGNHATVYGAYIGDSLDKDGGTNGCYYFDGNDYMEVARDASIEPDYITLSAWIKPHGLPTYGMYYEVINKSYTSHSNPYYSYRLGLFDDGDDDVFIVAEANGSWGAPDFLSDGSPTSYAWQHIAGTYDGDSIKVYRNGVKVASQENVGTIQYYNQILTFGKRENMNDGYFIGLLDNVRIYSRALTELEILTIYNKE